MRTKVRLAFRVTAVLAALLATAQPVLGSFSFFRGDAVDYATIHLVVGGILYNLTIALAIMAPFTRLQLRWVLLGAGVLQYGLLHAQLLLGLGSAEDVGLLAYHIPVGVLILIVAYLTATLSFGLRVEPSQA